MINRSEEYIRRRMKLLHLIPEVRQKVRCGAIGLAVSELLSCLPDERQKTVLATVEEQSLNAVQLSNLLTHQNDRRLVNAVFDTKECLQCPHNSAGQPDLFARESSGLGKCLYDPCWSEKELARAKSLAKQVEEMGPRAVIAGKIRIGLDDLPRDRSDPGGHAQQGGVGRRESAGLPELQVPGRLHLHGRLPATAEYLHEPSLLRRARGAIPGRECGESREESRIQEKRNRKRERQ